MSALHSIHLIWFPLYNNQCIYSSHYRLSGGSGRPWDAVSITTLMHLRACLLFCRVQGVYGLQQWTCIRISQRCECIILVQCIVCTSHCKLVPVLFLCSARSQIPDTSVVYTGCGETDPGMCPTTLVNVSILTCPHNYPYHCIAHM